jgi:hypothetical protein
VVQDLIHALRAAATDNQPRELGASFSCAPTAPRHAAPAPSRHLLTSIPSWAKPAITQTQMADIICRIRTHLPEASCESYHVHHRKILDRIVFGHQISSLR